MIAKRILVPERLRRPPATGWSWVDRRFLHEHADHLSRDAVLLYFFLSAAADRHGLSFYGDATLASRLRLPLAAVIQARDDLLARDLIAHRPPLTQVLSLPESALHRQPQPGQGLMHLGELFRSQLAGTGGTSSAGTSSPSTRRTSP